MKKPFIFGILLLLCTLLALWSPWFSWNFSFYNLFGVEEAEEISALRLYSLSGELEVFVDGESKGIIEEESSPIYVDSIEPGKRLITVNRISEVDNAYWSFSKLIEFEKDAEVVISLNIGPTEEFSAWHIITPKRSEVERELGNLNIELNVNDAEVRVDGTQAEIEGNLASERISFDQQHEISITKAGFEDLSFTILPETQEERDNLKGFDIMIQAHLLYLPLKVE